MPERELRENLEQLHQQLSSGPPLDPEARRQLADLARDIEAMLGDDPSKAPNLIDRLHTPKYCSARY